MKLMSLFSAKKGSASLSQTTRRSLYISIAVHVCLISIAAGWIISSVFINNTPTFVGQPSPTKTYDPKKLEQNVKIKNRQASSSRPAVVPRIVAMKTAGAIPVIPMDPKVITTSFQPKFTPVQGDGGFGAGFGNGNGEKGFGDSMSKINIFDLTVIGEKVMICVDVSISMVEESKGGIKNYEKVKARLNQVIDSLSEGTIFNVVAFADAARTFQDKLVFANEQNKKEAKIFVKYYNTEGSYGLTTGNVNPDNKGLQAQGGTTRLDLALTAAFQQGADTILVISDGAPMVLKGFTAEQMQARGNIVDNWSKEHATEIKKWQEQSADNGGGDGEKVWIPEQPARPPANKPLKEGEPPDMGSPAIPAHWEVARKSSGGSSRPVPPPLKPEYWSLPDFLTHLKMLHEEYYSAKGSKKPTIHCIGYMIDKQGDAFLKALAKEYKGQYKHVKKI